MPRIPYRGFPAVDRAAGDAIARRPRRARTASRCATTPASTKAARSRCYYDPMIAKLVTHAPDARGGDRCAGRRARRLHGRRHPPQHPVPGGADAAPALARGTAVDRLHRRGISRWRAPGKPAGDTARVLAAVATAIDRCWASASARSRARCAAATSCASGAGWCGSATARSPWTSTATATRSW